MVPNGRVFHIASEPFLIPRFSPISKRFWSPAGSLFGGFGVGPATFAAGPASLLHFGAGPTTFGAGRCTSDPKLNQNLSTIDSGAGRAPTTRLFLHQTRLAPDGGVPTQLDRKMATKQHEGTLPERCYHMLKASYYWTLRCGGGRQSACDIGCILLLSIIPLPSIMLVVILQCNIICFWPMDPHYNFGPRGPCP